MTPRATIGRLRHRVALQEEDRVDTVLSILVAKAIELVDAEKTGHRVTVSAQEDREHGE